MKDIKKLTKSYDNNGFDMDILHMDEVHKNFHQPIIKDLPFDHSKNHDQSQWYTSQPFHYNNPRKEERRFKKFSIMFYYMKKLNCTSVIDVGFGAGYFTWNSAINGLKTLGLDFENGAYHVMSDMLINSNIDSLNLLSLNQSKITDVNDKFDALISLEVLEHLLDPLPLHEEQIKRCNKIIFMEEYCGDTTHVGHIAPARAKQEIVDMCYDYGFSKIPLVFGYPPEIYVKNELLKEING